MSGFRIKFIFISILIKYLLFTLFCDFLLIYWSFFINFFKTKIFQIFNRIEYSFIFYEVYNRHYDFLCALFFQKVG